jgi:hypothetical protein
MKRGCSGNPIITGRQTKMEPFSKVVSKQQKMMEYTRWRIRLAERLMRRFGIKDSAWLVGYCRISFDVQPEPHETRLIVKRFSKNIRKTPFVKISLS